MGVDDSYASYEPCQRRYLIYLSWASAGGRICSTSGSLSSGPSGRKPQSTCLSARSSEDLCGDSLAPVPVVVWSPIEKRVSFEVGTPPSAPDPAGMVSVDSMMVSGSEYSGTQLQLLTRDTKKAKEGGTRERDANPTWLICHTPTLKTVGTYHKQPLQRAPRQFVQRIGTDYRGEELRGVAPTTTLFGGGRA